MKRLISILAMLTAVLLMRAQTTVSGVVKDVQSGRPLAHVNISAEGTEVHTVTNDDGRFTLKTPHQPNYIQLSHIGYKTRRQSLRPGQTEGLQLSMVSNTIELKEVIVSAQDPLEVVKAAMSHIPQNYPKEPELVRCFYRETAQRGSRFISVAEAVTEMYKTGYLQGPEWDAVAILKGRRLMSMKASDTLGVKIQGGPMLPVMADVAKNSEYVLNPDMLYLYTYHMELPVWIDDRLHYVVRMSPQSTMLYPLLGGLLYIEQKTLTITRAELQLDIRDWRLASEYMLVHKPFGLRFRPKELSVTVVYSTDGQGVTRMSYLCNVMRFNCDWKRRLFAHTFTTVCEMVVTDRLQHGQEAKRPKGRSSFGMRDNFYDRVEYFEDPDFWADYNIIEPTESLEHAIDKLKKKNRSSRM